ncbi:MAG TPA: chloride channel protein [Bacteroidia bacterium]|jgi:H+/Cl- antiporter ClcA|nr:chloride channel protein [Bacteroidia bacterium]
MKKNNVLNNGIPVSVSLNPALEAENFEPRKAGNNSRVLYISLFAFLIAIVISFTAKLLVALIDLFTNISFYNRFSFTHSTPADNHLGIYVIFVPAIGGIVVGLMALYGSKAIRGHGIPEAMEQILTNKSKIKPAITYLKPLSAAISIGTGGPFGAEGPIIATGGAFGSTIGQLMKISHNERKVLLAAGATAGMSAIFGSPVAAIFLAIELLLFEFSPRSLIPVAIACITGAAGHHFLFGTDPVFSMNEIATPSNTALGCYIIIGLVIGILSALVTKAVYFIEDLFEKLPVKWIWWPAIGGLIVGVVGYFSPRTLGVGYENISDVLSGHLTMSIILSLCVMKFISWAIALGSGTSGGTLAPLLTIGGAAGTLIGMSILHLFPGAEITLPVAALIGMSAMFAGASRALLTSIIFALETTGRSNALLPLLAACLASYFVSFFLMKNTIMTEKIARRGVKTPHSYEPDLLERTSVADVMREEELVLSEENTIGEIKEWLFTEKIKMPDHFVVTDNEGVFRGMFSCSELLSDERDMDEPIGSLISIDHVSVFPEQNLRTVAEIMSEKNVEAVPVLSSANGNMLVGVLSYKDLLSVYRSEKLNHDTKERQISLKRGGLKILLRGKKMALALTSKNKQKGNK